MSEEQELEHTLDVARKDLEHDLGQLQDIVKEKLDVPMRIRNAVNRVADEVGSRARSQPLPAIGIAAGLGILVALFCPRGAWRQLARPVSR